MIRAVLDTNVFFSAVLTPDGPPAQILVRWEEHRFVLLLSRLLLEEIDEVLRYPRVRHRHGWSEEEINGFASRLAEMAAFTAGQARITAVPEDPDDDPLVACALEGKADFLVSGDQHLLGLGSYAGIQIVTPAAFLEWLEAER